MLTKYQAKQVLVNSVERLLTPFIEGTQDSETVRELKKMLPTISQLWIDAQSALHTPPEHKRYMCFYMEQYYPGGGLSDVVTSFNTLEEVEDYQALHPVHCVFDRLHGVEII